MRRVNGEMTPLSLTSTLVWLVSQIWNFLVVISGIGLK